jgi:hypothetical protein
MADHDTEHELPPADPPVEGNVADAEAADTEGHSMLTLELGRTMERDRVRETETTARQHARAREAHAKREGGLLRRFRRG